MILDSNEVEFSRKYLRKLMPNQLDNVDWKKVESIIEAELLYLNPNPVTLSTENSTNLKSVLLKRICNRIQTLLEKTNHGS